MDVDDRIKRFEEMAQADGGNDMVFFSLGGAYTAAGRHADAAGAYMKCIALNESMSKAYQLAGASLIEHGDTERAKDLLTKGHAIAGKQGDLMPQQGMAELLEKIGAPVPKVKKAAPVVTGGFIDRRTGRPGTKMPAPFKGAVGAWLSEHISKETFEEWVGLGTKVINELRLDLTNDEHAAAFDYALRLFVKLDDDTYREIVGRDPETVPSEYKGVVEQIMERMGELEEFGGELHTQV